MGMKRLYIKAVEEVILLEERTRGVGEGEVRMRGGRRMGFSSWKGNTRRDPWDVSRHAPVESHRDGHFL